MRATILTSCLLLICGLAQAAGEATQFVLTIRKVEFKNTSGDWKTAFEGELPIDLGSQDPSAQFENKGRLPDGSYVGVRLTLDETVVVSGADGTAFTREGGEVEIRGTAQNLDTLPGQIQSLSEQKPSYSQREPGSLKVTLDFDYADRDRIIEIAATRDFSKVLDVKTSSKVTIVLRADVKSSIVHVWPDYYGDFPESDAMIVDFPKSFSEFSVKVDGVSAFSGGRIDVKF